MSELALGQTIRLISGNVGVIRFIGTTHFSGGEWVGIELEDDSGKNDGSVQGTRYFDCAMGRGMFVRPTTITVVAQAAAAAKTGLRKSARPSSMSSAAIATRDPVAGKRMSLNAPSPSQAPRTSRPSSIARSPIKSPTKQLVAGPLSAAGSRKATPSNVLVQVSRCRTSMAGPRTSMGPLGQAGAKPTSTASGRPGRVERTAARADLAPNTSGASSALVHQTRSTSRCMESPRTSDETAESRMAAASSSGQATRIEELEAKLQGADKARAERDKFERIMHTLQIKYQPLQQENAALKRAVQEAKEAHERLASSIESMNAEHDSAMELATLDREMAEELAENSAAELEALKQRAEELELELEVVREENAEFTTSMSSEERSSTGWIQMEKTHERLREALMRLRDLRQQEGEELRGQIKALEEELRDYEALQARQALMGQENTRQKDVIDDLRQQLDTALGAEEMIEDLAERNMAQAEQMDELRATIEHLENLKDIADELEINQAENAKEMQHEIDRRDGIHAELLHEKAQQAAKIEDLEYTVLRFREFNKTLQSDLDDLRASQAVSETESQQLKDRSRAMLDLDMKLTMSAAKAQAKTIDLELRRLDAQQAEQQLEIVGLFLLDSYQAERDSVTVLLQFQRLAFKANLLNTLVQERIKEPLHAGHEDDLVWGCDAVVKLTWLAAMSGRFVEAVSHCGPDDFARYQGMRMDLEPVERALNGWIDGLKRDHLEEKQCASELQRTMALMTHLAATHMAHGPELFADETYMTAVLMGTQLDSAAHVFGVLSTMVERAVRQPGGGGGDDDDDDDDDGPAVAFARQAEAVIGPTRSAKVQAQKLARAVDELKTRSLALVPDLAEAFELCETATAELAETARQAGMDLHSLVNDQSRTEPVALGDLQDCVANTAQTLFGARDVDLFTSYLNKLRVAAAQIRHLLAVATGLDQTQEFERSAAPWLVRAQELQLRKTVPAETEDELRRLKEQHQATRALLAVRDGSLEEAHLKIDTLEARMRDAKAKADTMAELEIGTAQAKQQIAALQEEMAKQDRELKTLEDERDRWCKMAGDSKARLGGADQPANVQTDQQRATATVLKTDALQAEVDGLGAAVRFLREDSRRARLTEQSRHDWLAEPLRKPAPPAQQRRQRVAAEGRDAIGELVRIASAASYYRLEAPPTDKRRAWRPAKSTPQYHAARQMESFAAWEEWEGNVLRKAKVLSAGSNRRKPAKKSVLQHTAATLQIRLPGPDGKPMAGLGVGHGLPIVGARAWDSLQIALSGAV